MTGKHASITTALWHETAAADNPFSAEVITCAGYDVYKDILQKAGYFEYLFLLFRGERPTQSQACLLETLAIAIANPGPRDPSVHAAMAAAIGSPPAASCLYAALACAAGSYGGAREVLLAFKIWQTCGKDLTAWEAAIKSGAENGRHDVWPACEHFPGFSPHESKCSPPVLQTLQALSATSPDSLLTWLQDQRLQLESLTGRPLAMSGVAACAFYVAGFSAEAAEMLYLLLRLPGAAAHALEQQQQGFRQFPFFQLDLQNDPARTAQGGTE